MTWATCQFDGSNTSIDTGQNRIRAASYGIVLPSRSRMLETDTRSSVTATFYESISFPIHPCSRADRRPTP